MKSLTPKKHFFLLNSNIRIKKLGLVISLSTFAFSIVSSVWAVYLKTFLNNDAYVGLMSSFLILVALASYFLIIPIIERSDKFKLTVLTLFIISISYLIYYFVENLFLLIIVSTFMTVFITVFISAKGILIKDNSSRKKLSKNEGLVYTLYNTAFIIGPLIGSLIIFYFGIRYVFIFIPFILLLSVSFLKSLRVKHGEVKKKLDSNVFKNFLDFFKSRDRVYAYLLGSGVNFWWSLVYIYFPLLIVKELSNEWIGIFLAVIPIPLVLFEYKFGIIAGKKGYKKIFFIGFLIPALLAFFCFVFFNLWFIVSALIIASIGLAMTESTTESYFFDISKGKEDQRFYSPYNTAIDFGSLLGHAIPAVILIFFDFKYIFLVYSFGMMILALLSLTMKDIIESRRK